MLGTFSNSAGDRKILCCWWWSCSGAVSTM